MKQLFKAHLSPALVKAVVSLKEKVEIKSNGEISCWNLSMIRVFLSTDSTSLDNLSVVCDYRDFQKLEALQREAEFFYDYDRKELICKNSETEIRIYANEDSIYYPEKIDKITFQNAITIPSHFLYHVIKRMSSFTDNNERYRYKECIYMNANDIVASDGYRLAIYKPKAELPFDAYIYRDVFKALKLLLPITENVEIYATEDFTVIVGLNKGVKVFEVYCENLGYYPNYREVIKDLRFNHVFKFDRNAFIKTLKENKNAELVIMRISSSNALLEFQNEDSKVCKQINIENLTNSNLIIAFNPKFLKEGLEAIDGKYVEMKVIDNESITQFSSDDNFTYFLMPVKIKEV
mgnify:CR=1 FL=1